MGSGDVKKGMLQNFRACQRVGIFYPPLGRKSGGTEVLLQIASTFTKLGLETVLGFWESPSHALQGELNVLGLHWKLCTDLDLGKEDLWIVPDGWVNGLSLGLKAGARCVLYCQSWTYLFNGLPENVRWHDLPVEFLAVSHPVACFMDQVMGKRPPVVRPYIDTELFYPSKEKPSAPPVRVAFMPRKNSALIMQIRRIVQERQPDLFSRITWVRIEGESRKGVADILRSCHVFLASGFPEGFALPPLEAMACGCIPVGFTGLGGWDYMRQAGTGCVAPPLELRPVDWEGNGMYFADGDVLGAALGLEKIVGAIIGKDENILDIIQAGSMTGAAYGHEQQWGNIQSWLKTF